MYSKSLILYLFFGFCFKNIDAQVCSNPLNVIYGLQQSGGVVPININTLSVDSSINGTSSAGYPGSTHNANAIGLNIQTKTFYYFQKNAYNAQQFVSYNSVTNQYTVLASSPISGSVVKGCVNPDGTAYYCIDGSGIICYYNIASNTWKKINSSLTDQFNNNLASVFSSLGSGDIAIDGIGNMWIIVSSPTQWGLYELKAPLPVNSMSNIELTEIITPTQATPSGTQFAGIAYNATGQIFLSTGNDLYLLQNNLSIMHIGTFSVAGSGADLTSCNYPVDVLPLSWTAFTASLHYNNSVLLKWSVNQQGNDKGYIIEHSSNGDSWENIGYQNDNYATGKSDYSFTHSSPGNGMNYYRIQRLGIESNKSYSEIKKVNIIARNYLSIWPIPAANTLYVQIVGIDNSYVKKVIILNSAGKMITSVSLHVGVNSIDINSLPVGNYIIHANLPNGDIVNQKFVKL